MKPFQSPDFMCIDDHLTEDEKMIRETIRQFVSREIIPTIGDYFMKN